MKIIVHSCKRIRTMPANVLNKFLDVIIFTTEMLLFFKQPPSGTR